MTATLPGQLGPASGSGRRRPERKQMIAQVLLQSVDVHRLVVAFRLQSVSQG